MEEYETGTFKQLIEVKKNGVFFMKEDGYTIADTLDTCYSNIVRKAAEGGTMMCGNDKYSFRYTGETAPRKNPYEKPEPTKKPDISVSDVVRMGRANGLSYGYQSALMMAAKERNGK